MTASQQARLKQGGASAVEFALVLPVLLALIYSMFVYSYAFVVRESINYAAQLGAEAAVAVAPDPIDTYQSRVTGFVQASVAGALSWMPATLRDSAIGANGSAIVPLLCNPEGGGPSAFCPVNPTGGTPLVVPITVPVQSPHFPVINLPGLGAFPPMPATLSAVGVGLL